MGGWKKLSRKVVYKTPWFFINRDAVLDPTGKATTYSTFNFTNDPVHIVAMDDEHNIYLVKQFRYPVGSITWELPAGHTDGQSAVAAAKRELLEETGLVAKKIEKVGDYVMTPGVSGSKMQLVFAYGVKKQSDDLDKVDGIEAVKKCTISEMKQMIKKGEVMDSLSITGFYFALEYLKNVGVTV